MTSPHPAHPGQEDTALAGSTDDAKQTVLEMRQVAGLTAGSVMDLHRGSFQFRESDKEVGFSLVVDEQDQASVVAGAASTAVDEIFVAEPTPLGDAVLNVGSACFTVRPPRPAPDPVAMVEQLEAARRPSRAISVPVFRGDDQLPAQTTSSRFGSLFSKDTETEEPQEALDAQSWEFLESIRDARSLVAERHRYLHPNPEELRSRLERLDPGLWDRTVEHPLFARFAVAYATIPWEPRFDRPEDIPLPLHRPIQEMSCLPWVPVTANLLFGPLGIVGSRSAALACARNAVLSLACSTSPDDIEFSIVTAQGLVDDWKWTSSLPNTLFPNGATSYCVAVADGMAHFDGAGFDHEAVKNNEMGLIVLAETLEELPDYCGTVLLISPDGQCQVTNHLGERVSGTPIGVTADFAVAAAAIIRDAVGDGDAEEAEEALSDPANESVTVGPDGTATPAAAPGPPIDDIVFEEAVLDEPMAEEAVVEETIVDEPAADEPADEAIAAPIMPNQTGGTPDSDHVDSADSVSDEGTALANVDGGHSDAAESDTEAASVVADGDGEPTGTPDASDSDAAGDNDNDNDNDDTGSDSLDGLAAEVADAMDNDDWPDPVNGLGDEAPGNA